ncbi:hypothetical protein [Nitrospirillum sp. BR 11163]|uniref:hypothetical protein n=1 Tax=Nitrospirillum sp. BR 11163 TaxID=3104323 RepID=UPI002AFFF09A|nr:hypothetical protein [Nitrospirillum sp. BR 11163]MEA1674084.1 hypothetical protein [Nitrospirillum sp. BR 11163]
MTPPLTLDDARLMAFAMMTREPRMLRRLHCEVHRVLGLRRPAGRRLDLLHDRLAQLILSSPAWAARGRRARRQLMHSLGPINRPAADAAGADVPALQVA